nr:MAG TPA: hypothetical protein [Caudoviricetes sp.]
MFIFPSPSKNIATFTNIYFISFHTVFKVAIYYIYK